MIGQNTSSTQTSIDNITKIDISVDTQNLAKKRDTIKISLQSTGKVLSEVWDSITKESTNNSVNCSASAAQDTADFIDIQATPNLETKSLSKKKIPSDKINIKTPYTLSRGRVAFHFEAQEDKQI